MKHHTKQVYLAGFTLLELLIAVALLSVVAVLSFRGLDSILNTRERLVQVSDETRALSVAFTQIEEDLRRSWSSRLLNTGSPALGFLPGGQPDAPQLVLLRENSGTVPAARMQTVIYRVRDGQLERGFGLWRRGLAADPLAMVWQPVLERVAALQMRVWVDEQSAWLEANALIQNTNPALTIGGIEMALARQDGQRIVRMIAIRD
jgi:general secretion pathway protein J